MPGKKETPALAPLLPLAIAAEVAYARATGKHTKDLDSLNNVARLIASRTRVFSVESGEPAMLMPDEVMEGRFEQGGAVLRFTAPRRPPIGELVILLVDLGQAVEDVERLYGRTPG